MSYSSSNFGWGDGVAIGYSSLQDTINDKVVNNERVLAYNLFNIYTQNNKYFEELSEEQKITMARAFAEEFVLFPTNGMYVYAVFTLGNKENPSIGCKIVGSMRLVKEHVLDGYLYYFKFIK